MEYQTFFDDEEVMSKIIADFMAEDEEEELEALEHQVNVFGQVNIERV